MESVNAGTCAHSVRKGKSVAVLAAALFVGCPGAAAGDILVGPPRAVDPEPAWLAASGVPVGLASNGVDWLALTAVDGGSNSLWGTRISADGTVLDHPHFLIAAVEDIRAAPPAFDGTHYVAAWAQSPGENDPWSVHLQRIASDGTWFGPNVTVGSLEPSALFVSLAMASGSSSDLVVWCEMPDVFQGSTCTWVQVEGANVVESDSMTFDFMVSDLDVAASNDAWLIAFTSSAQEVSLVRVGDDGLALDGTPFPLATPNAFAISAELAPAESGWAVIWRGTDGLMSALVSQEGTVAPHPVPLVDEETFFFDFPTIARMPQGFGGNRRG